MRFQILLIKLLLLIFLFPSYPPAKRIQQTRQIRSQLLEALPPTSNWPIRMEITENYMNSGGNLWRWIFGQAGVESVAGKIQN